MWVEEAEMVETQFERTDKNTYFFFGHSPV